MQAKMARMDAPGNKLGEVDLAGRIATLSETKQGGYKECKHVFIEMRAEVTETLCSSETPRNERNMSPMEMELFRTLGINDYIHGKQHFPWQLALNHPTSERRHVKTARGRMGGRHIVYKYRRHKQRREREAMPGRCKRRSRCDRYNNKK